MDTENQREIAERYDKYGAMLYRLCLVMLCSRQDAVNCPRKNGQ